MLEKLVRSPVWRWPLYLGSTFSLIGCSLLDPPQRVEKTYVSNGTTLGMHLYQPRGVRPAQGWPTVLMFHGGAWQTADIELWRSHCIGLQRLGYQCVSATYRVHDTHATGVREAIADARAALAHLRTNAQVLGVDKNNLVLGGGSAGGHLAALLGTGQPDSPPESVAGLLLFNPMINLEPGRPDHEYVADFWRDVSPQHQLHSALPPTLLLLGDRDAELPVPVARAFCDKINALGGQCEMELTPGARHGFFHPKNSRRYYLQTLWRSHVFLRSLRN